MWRWEYKSLPSDRTSGHAVQEGDSKGRRTPGCAFGTFRTARRAASCIHSRAQTWRSSPASTGAESGQTSRGRLSERKPTRTPPPHGPLLEIGWGRPLSEWMRQSDPARMSTHSSRVNTKVGPLCVLLEVVPSQNRKVCAAVCVCVRAGLYV